MCDEDAWGLGNQLLRAGQGGKIFLNIKEYSQVRGIGLFHNEPSPSPSPSTSQPQYNTRPTTTGLTEIEDDTLVRKECVGAGGFGRVFRAEWDGQNVAVKELNVTSIEEEVRPFSARHHPRLPLSLHFGRPCFRAKLLVFGKSS